MTGPTPLEVMGSHLETINTLSTALATVTAERDQARQTLADAPHGPHCSSLIPVPDPPRYGCDCWKAGL